MSDMTPELAIEICNTVARMYNKQGPEGYDFYAIAAVIERLQQENDHLAALCDATKVENLERLEAALREIETHQEDMHWRDYLGDGSSVLARMVSEMKRIARQALEDET